MIATLRLSNIFLAAIPVRSKVPRPHPVRTKRRPSQRHRPRRDVQRQTNFRLIFLILLAVIVAFLALAFAYHYQRLEARQQAQADMLRQANADVEQARSDAARARNEARLQISHLATLHRDSLLGWGDSLGNAYVQRRSRYEQAVAVATDYHLNASDAQRRLEALNAEIRSNAPTALKRGSKATLQNATFQDPLPLLFLSVSVTTQGNNFISGLSAKDFALTTENGLSQPIALAETEYISGSLSIAILIDCSNSTAGAALEEAKAGTKLTLRSLPESVFVRLYSFGERVQTRTDWTNDLSLAANALDTISSDGNTPLFAALSAAARDLASRPTPRAILLFTDGQDTLGGYTPEAVIDELKTHQVSVYAVSLKTEELDAAFLDRLASATGGVHLSTARIAELPHTFSTIVASLAQPIYRLAFLLSDSHPPSLTLRIGAENHIDLPIRRVP